MHFIEGQNYNQGVKSDRVRKEGSVLLLQSSYYAEELKDGGSCPQPHLQDGHSVKKPQVQSDIHPAYY